VPAEWRENDLSPAGKKAMTHDLVRRPAAELTAIPRPPAGLYEQAAEQPAPNTTEPQEQS
jgi:hypothetical protein